MRAAARHALALALPTASLDDIVAALPAAYRLKQARREQHDVWLAEFERSVLALVGEERLLQAVRATDMQVARAALRLLAHGSAVKPQVLFEAVVPASSDVVLAACAFDHLVASGAGFNDALLVRALRSKVTANRARALQGLIDRGVTSHVDAALFAPQAQVRAVATAFMARQGADLGALYAQALGAPGNHQARTVACLAELSKLRRPAFLDAVRAWTAHTSLAVRAAACLAWFQLAPHGKEEIAAHLLADPSPRLRKWAVVLIHKHGAHVPLAQARSLLERHDDKARLREVAACDPWTWLETIAELASSGQLDQQCRLRLQHHLHGWMATSARSYTQPDEMQRGRLTRLLKSGVLDPLIGPCARPEWNAVLVQFGAQK